MAMQQPSDELSISLINADQLSVPVLCQLWNEGFSNYYVPMELTPETFMALVRRELISLPDSFVALAADRPVGFVMLGLRRHRQSTIGYVAGAAVVPDYRRRGLAQRLMQALLSRAKELSVQQVTLTAVGENSRAIRLYEQLGFRTTRQLICWERMLYQGFWTPPPEELSLMPVLPQEVRSLSAACYRQAPEWQNRPAGEKLQLTQAVLARWQDVPVGYSLYAGQDPLHLYQLGVLPEWRRRGIGRALFQHLASDRPGTNLIYLNHPQEEVEASAWLRAMGCLVFLYQVEMSLWL